MEIFISKHNPVASDVSLLENPDKTNRKHEDIHQSNFSSCANTEAQNFTKLSKQNIQQHADLIELGKIYL